MDKSEQRCVSIEYINESYCRVVCTNPADHESLANQFCFRVENYFFIKQKDPLKYANWDGYIRLLNNLTGEFPAGLIPELLKKCRKAKIKFNVDDRYWPKNKDIPREKIENFFHEIVENSPLDLDIRPYQIDAMDDIVRNQRRTIVSSTGSGKSLIIFAVLKWIIEKEKMKKCLLIVPRVSLVEQMIGDMRDYIGAEWVEKNIHGICEGREKRGDKPIYISTWQSIYKMKKNYFRDFEAIMVDECHGASSKCMKGITDKCTNAKFRVGFTGTLKDTKSEKLQILGAIGPENEIVKTKELMETGFLSNMFIDFRILKYKNIDKNVVKDFNYSQELNFIIGLKERNEYIANLVNELSGNTLVLFNFVEKHGIPLFETFQEICSDSQNEIIHGSIPVKKREKIRKNAEHNDNMNIIASYGTFSTGVNIKNLHNIVLASPSKSKVRVLQSIGRGLRLHETKDKLNLYDIVDDLSFGKSTLNYSMKHFVERFDMYNEEEFDYDIVKVPISIAGEYT